MNAILTYHAIDDSGSPVSVSPAAFEAHRRWLVSGAIRTQPLADLVGSPAATADAVAVTFDDGFLNARRPIELLLDAGIIPTLFVVTQHVGENNDWGGYEQPGVPRLPLMSWDDLAALSDRGLRIEAHSRTHPHLSRLSPTQLDDELGGCCEDLRSHLGLRPVHLAYPYGDVNSGVAARAATWFSHGVTTEMARLAPQPEPMMLPRLDMYYYGASGALESWGRPSFGARLKFIALRRRLRAVLLAAGPRAER